MRILIVEDEADTRKFEEDLLTRDGHQVATAASAAEAIVRLGIRPFDLILLDIMMPGIDGHQLAQYLSGRWDTFETL